MTDVERNRAIVHALLADGSTVCIREVRPGDHASLKGLYDGMSAGNLRLRFFGASRRVAEQAADRACAPRRPGCRALLAEAQGRVIGLAEYVAGGDSKSAEISIAVADGLHHRGVGTLLVEHLISAARGGHHYVHGRRAVREPGSAAALRRLGAAHGPPFRGPGSTLHR